VYHVFVRKVKYIKILCLLTLSLLQRMPLSKVFHTYTSVNWQTHYTSKPGVFKEILKVLPLHSSSLIPRKCCNFDKHHFYCKAVIWFIPQTELQMWGNSKHVHFVLYSWIPSSTEPGWPVTADEYQGQIRATYICQISV